MGKFVLIFAAVLAAALVAVSAAQLGVSTEEKFRDRQCRREVLQNPLQSCREVINRQLTGRVGVVGAVPFQLDARAQCCQQIKGVSLECRCSAVRQMVRSYEQTLLPPLEGGYGGDWPAEQQPERIWYYGRAGSRQQGQEYYGGERPPQHGEVYSGEAAGRQQQQGEEYYGGERQQQEEGYSGEAAGRQQQQGEEYYGGERPQQPQGQGYSGEAAGRQQQQEQEYYGDERPQPQQQGEGYSGEAAGRQQQGEEYYGGERSAPPLITRVTLRTVQQYAARLPNMCQMEPLECSVFSYDQY